LEKNIKKIIGIIIGKNLEISADNDDVKIYIIGANILVFGYICASLLI